MKRDGFLNNEIATITGMNPQTIAYYSNHGLVEPSIDKGRGRGSNRLYSKRDIMKFLLIRELSSHGLSLDKIKIVFKQVDNREYWAFETALDPQQAWSAANNTAPHCRIFLFIRNVNSDSPDVTFADVDMTDEEESSKLGEWPVNIRDFKSVLIIDMTDVWSKVFHI